LSKHSPSSFQQAINVALLPLRRELRYLWFQVMARVIQIADAAIAVTAGGGQQALGRALLISMRSSTAFLAYLARD
jgi:hypothetical protein